MRARVKTGMNWLRQLERLLLIVGVLMLALYVAARIHRTVLSNAELQRFKVATGLGGRT